MKREIKFYVLMVVLILCYISVHYFNFVSDLEETITTVMAIIAAIGFWLELKRSKDLHEATFIMDLNNQFAANQDFMRIERALEIYYDQWLRGIPTHRIKLDLDLSRDSADCQSLINYLVYMEGLAALVECGVMRLKVIDNLFAYRFFIAANNPVVQKFEILPYANFYQGCFELSRKWTKQWRDKKRPIPMEREGENNALCECPADLMNKPFKPAVISIEIRPLTADDDLMQAAKCLYLTDPYIYPTAFGDNVENAAKAIAELMKTEGCLLHFSNFAAAFYGKELCGIVLCNKDGFIWDKAKCERRIRNIVQDIKAFDYAVEHYFAPVSKAPDEGCVELVALCVNPSFRNKGVGKKLLQWVSQQYPGHTFELDVLSDNHGAITLYRHCGFKVKNQHKGFAKENESAPDCYRMERQIISADRSGIFAE